MRGVPATSAFRLLGLGVFTLWLVGTALLIWLMLIVPNQHQAAPYRDVVLEVPANGGLPALAGKLVELKFIDQPSAFVAFMRLLGADTRLRQGFVVVNRALSIHELLPRLASGYGVAQVLVPIPEGFTRFDIAGRLARYGVCNRLEFEAATRDLELLTALSIPGESVEGYLFPATYALSQGSAAQDVIKEMVRVFRERTRARFAAYELEHDGAPLSFTELELLTLASMIEREARLPEERPTIAGVFMNRLTSPDFKPRRLQSDPTVAYGCLIERELIPSCAEFDGRRKTPAMVRDPVNRYSTYRNEGLPPGPICNPGLSALDAALAPAQHNYFYFVTSGGGHHAFTHSLEEHNARVRASP